jgi:hypothetical protein
VRLWALCASGRVRRAGVGPRVPPEDLGAQHRVEFTYRYAAATVSTADVLQPAAAKKDHNKIMINSRGSVLKGLGFLSAPPK